MPSTSPAPKPVTPRQQEAATLAAQGLTYKQIAKALGITRATARYLIIAVATRLPGDGTKPMWRVRQWMLTREHAA